MVLLLFISTASAENVTMPNHTELQELGAFDPISNLQSNMTSISEMNLSDNYLLNILEWDNNASSYDNTVRIIMFPISYGASDEFVGDWFYAFLIISTLIVIYGKSKSLEVTTMIMLIISLVIILANAGGALVIPSAVLNMLYVCAILGFFGAMYSLFGDD